LNSPSWRDSRPGVGIKLFITIAMPLDPAFGFAMVGVFLRFHRLYLAKLAAIAAAGENVDESAPF